MIDINKLIQSPELFVEEMNKRHLPSDTVHSTAELALEVKSLKTALDKRRAAKNQFNEQINAIRELPNFKELLANQRENSVHIIELESAIRGKEYDLAKLLADIPNLTSDLTPKGRTDKDNQVFYKTPTKAPAFTPTPYYELPIFKEDYLAEKGSKAAGFRGYYIKGELAKLQRKLFQWSANQIEEYGFEYIVTPILVNETVLEGTGFFPKGKEDAYAVKDGESDKYLTGTSEAPLMFMHSGETLDLTKPKLLTATTRCFRKESGAYGKDTKGGIRVTQFDKTELVALCEPTDEEAHIVFEQLASVFTWQLDQLGLAYQKVEVCSGDMSLKNHRQVDIEGWFPATNEYRELCSVSNCTDYQTRGLKIHCMVNGQKQLAYSLNCTGMVNRVLYALLEQCQREDGSIEIPEVLK
jgi:seryl-tRNA synthetase